MGESACALERRGGSRERKSLLKGGCRKRLAKKEKPVQIAKDSKKRKSR